jgi:RHS repeat-associated protein
MCQPGHLGRFADRLLVPIALLVAAPQSSRAVQCGDTAFADYFWTASGQINKDNNCQGSTGFRCYDVENPGSYVQLANPSCNPISSSCTVNAHATATVPGLRDMVLEESSIFVTPTPWVEWYPCSGASCAKDITCGTDGFGGRINRDDVDSWASVGLTCATARYLNLSAKFRVCAGVSSCEKTKIIDIGSLQLSSSIGCPLPLMYAGTEGCGDDGGGSGGDGTGGGGRSAPSCSLVNSVGGGGGGCSVSGEGNVSCAPAWAGNASLRFAGGGVGTTGLPGASAWRTTLGLFWSHDFAERIVVDTDTTSPGHVWLLTKHGTFREFSNLASGSGLRLYQQRAPSDEFRQLYYDTSTGEWQLESLNGRTDFYRSDGQWKKTVTTQDPSHATEGTYNGSGQLTAVSFPDGHGDSFTYQSNGKLSTITTEPVSGSGTSARTWTLTWSGDELTEVARPDGRSWVFTYDSSRPGYLTRASLVSDSSSRVVAAFSYLSGSNRVEHSWSGDTSFTGSNAVDKMAFAYTNVTLPTEVEITRTVSATFDDVTTYTLGRDTRSAKPKVTSIERSCPTCSQTSTTTYAFAGSNALLTSSMTDARETRTDYTYDSNGRLLTRTEAANVSGLTRVTSYTYDTNFPGLVTRIEVPSTSGGSNKRRTDFAYESTTGVLETISIDGYEAGSPLSNGYKVTTYTANSSGEFTAIDPPGYSTDDEVTFTYGATGHVLASRTDPLVGTTTYDYDGFNRRTSTTDPNGVETVTTYDVLDRVTDSRRIGDPSPDEDLVTKHFYNAFGDLFCTKLPRGNGVEYGYDSAGRPTTVTRGTVVSSPSSTSCIDTGQPRERTIYQLDGVGHRVDESRETWTGSAWASAYHATYVHTCQLDKTTLGAGSSSPSVSEYCYDPNGNLEKLWDANHAKSTFTNPTQLFAYDALNRVTSVTVGPSTSGAAATQHTYDVQDHLASVTDAEGNQTTYTTSDRDLVTQQVSPASGTTTYTYDEHGQRLLALDARGIAAQRTLDAAGRVTSEVFGEGEPLEVATTYTYGSTPAQFDVGRLIEVDTSTGIDSTLEYDRFGRLVSDSGVDFGYDENGNRNRIDYPYHGSALYTHDYADREATLEFDDDVSGTLSIVSESSYAPGGPLTSLTLGNGIVETRSFDSRYFADEIAAGSHLDWDLTLDGVGNPTGIAGSLNGTSSTATYSYQDYLYFLTGASGPWGSRTWTYDKIGNRLTSSGTSLPSWAYSYSASGHGPKLQSVAESASSTTWSFTHDAAGNQTEITETISSVAQWTTTYTIGTDGRIFNLSPAEVWDSTATNVVYDGRGRLAKAARVGIPWSTLIPENDSATYSPDGQLLSLSAEYGETGESFVLADDFLYFAGRPVFTRSQRSVYGDHFITTDHLGTPVLATDDSGDVLGSDWTDPFRPHTGVILQYPGQWTDTALWIPGGYESDRIDQLFYNVNRWYSAQTGRYSSADPLWQQSAFPYSYVENKPLRYVDPLGLERVPCNKCEDLEGAVRNTERRIVLLHTTGSEIDPTPGASNVIGAETYCAASGTWGSGATWRNPDDHFQDQPCGFLCTGVHERVHRRMCESMGAAFIGLPRPQAEIPAYAEERRCLQGAIDQGWLELTPGGVEYPGSTLTP